MQRNVNESFAAYKIRRAISNQAVKDTNKESKGGSATSHRSKRLVIASTGIKGIKGGARQYGASLKAHFDSGRRSAIAPMLMLTERNIARLVNAVG